MSGERIRLAGDVDGNAARLVQATGRLADADLGPHALVGGLAVMCRLAAVHRATQDVDTVTELTAPSAIEVITATIGAPDPTSQTRAIVDGIRIDVIDTGSFVDADLDGIAPGDRLFVVSHRWALDTATRTEISADAAAASIAVATPPALVGMKAATMLGARPREPRKRASDLYDIYRLVLDHDRTGGLADALVAAPFGLGRLVGDALRGSVLDVPERAVRQLADGGPEMAAVTPDDLRDVISPLVDRLID